MTEIFEVCGWGSRCQALGEMEQGEWALGLRDGAKGMGMGAAWVYVYFIIFRFVGSGFHVNRSAQVSLRGSVGNDASLRGGEREEGRREGEGEGEGKGEEDEEDEQEEEEQ